MTELPSDWSIATIDDLVDAKSAITDGPFGSNLKTSHYTDTGPRVIRLQNIGDGVFIDERAHISEEHYDRLKKHAAQEGDLIVASLGTELPRSCLVPRELGPAIVKADCIRVRIDRSVADERYVNYLLNSPQLHHQAAEVVHGVGRPRLGLKGIRQLKLPMAPLDEQRRIVDTIEQQLSCLDSAGAALRRSLRALGVLEDVTHARVLLLDARKVRLADVCRTSSGGTPRRGNAKYFGGDIPWIKSGELGDSEVTFTAETITEVGLHESSAKLLPRGTLLVAMYGATIGKLGWVGFDRAATNQAVAAIMPSDDLDPRFLWHVLRAKRREFLAKGIGGAQYNISQEILRETTLPLPSLDSQRHLVDDLERTLDLQRHLTTSVNLAVSRARSLRRSVLSAAFNGRLHHGDAQAAGSYTHDPCDERAEDRGEPTMQRAEVS